MTTMIFTTEQTGVAFYGAEKMGSTPWQLWPDHPCKTYVSSPAIIFRGVMVFFQVSHPDPDTHRHISPFAPPTAGAVSQYMFKLSFRMFSTDLN
jgi:hypothetical protein